MARSRPLALALLLIATLGPPLVAPTSRAQGTSGEKLAVVATYSILGDFVRNVGGEAVDLRTLVGPGGDAHTFEPSPADGAALTEADVVVENGLGFEPWFDDLYAASGTTAPRIDASSGIAPLAAGEEDDHDGGEETAARPVRVLVADAEAPIVRVVEAGTGKVLAAFDVRAPGRVVAGGDGRYGYVVQGDGDVVHAVDGGLSWEAHGDHGHLVSGVPTMLPATLTGDNPIHFVAHGDQVASFNDDDGTAVVATEADLTDPDAALLRIRTARPHHGVAVPLGDRVLVSRPGPDPEDSLPVGIDVYATDGSLRQTLGGCPGLHGEATIGETAVFACADGVLLVGRAVGGDSFVGRKATYPAATDPETRAGTLVADEEGAYVWGNFGDDAMVRIDPTSGAMTVVPNPAGRAAFALEPGADGHLVVLTVDGRLHLIESDTGATAGSVPVVAPFSLEGSYDVVRPSLAVDAGLAVVGDPVGGAVIPVTLPDLAVGGPMAVGGMPSGVALLGPGPEPGSEPATVEAAATPGGTPTGIATPTGMATETDTAQETGGEDHAGHGHGEVDPHIWHDVQHATVMVANVRDGLVAADPANAATYRANAAAYLAELNALDAEVFARVEALPEDRRKLVTTHDTFGYFADRYGFEVLGTALGSVTTEAADPSAGEIAALVEEIRASGVPAIFAENIANPDLMRRIADEAGVELAPTLYTDALGEPGSTGETYLAMVRHNVTTIVTALGS